MKRFTLLLFTSLFIISGFLVKSTTVFSQSLLSSTITGDVLHAESGSDFIGVLYAKGTGIYYNQVNSVGVWGTEAFLGAGTEGRLFIDSNDNTYVVFTATTIPTKIAYLKYNGSEWSEIEYLVSNNGGSCSKPDIAVDINGFSHITYTDTQGNTHWYQNKSDIMYATNATSSFVNSVIFDGYYENLGGSSYQGEYFEKGSFISLDSEGNYFIMACARYFYKPDMYPGSSTYSIGVKSTLESGSSTSSSSDIFTISDLEYDGNAIFALYKQSTCKASELTISGTAISFSNTQDFTTSSVSSIALNGTDMVVGGKTVSNLYTMHNDLEHVYANVVVKNSIVSAVDLGSTFYAVYTDNTDGIIKIMEVAEPLSFTRFDVVGQKGKAIIDGQAATVKVTLEADVDLTNLVATYTTTSDVTDVSVETVPQTSGVTANDFSSSLTYLLNDGVGSRNWVVTAKLEISKTIEASICEGESYLFGTQSPSVPGNYIETFTSVSGKDSTVLLILAVNPVYNEAKTVTICDSELPYSFGDQSLTLAGTYTETFTSIAGCDSIVALTLNINPVYNETKTVTICESELPYSFGDQSLTLAGTYTETFMSIAGCDSIVALTLNVNPVYNETKTATVCDSELPYSFGDQSLSLAGTYTETFTSIAGCDSIVALTLNVNPVFNESKTVTICDSELPYSFGDHSLTLAGTYTETFTSIAGCDSIVALTLNVNPVFNEPETVMICDSELPYAFGSQSLTESGVFTDRYTSVNGCDSIRTLTLTVNPVYNETAEKTVYLNELPFHFGIQELSESGTYTETFQSISGCDSIVTLTLTVLDIEDVTPVAVGSPISIYLNSNGSYILTLIDIYNLTKETTDENFDYGDLTFSVTPNFFNCSDAESTKTVRIIATNPLNNRDTCYTQVSIFDDTLPSILCKDVIVELNELSQASIQLDDILVSQYDACQIANISLSQTDFGCPDIGINQVIITVSDLHGNVNTCNSKVTVVSKNSRPTMDPIPDQTVDEDSELITIPLTGIGYGSDCQKQAISISASATKSSLISEINTTYTDGETTGALGIKVSPDVFGITDVTLVVTDSEGGTFTRTFNLTITPVNDAPIVLTDFEDIRIETIDTLRVYISSGRGIWFDDPDPDDVLHIQVKTLSGETLPDWIVFRNDSLIATPLKTDVGCIDILVQASDDGGLFATNTFKVCAEFPVTSTEIGEQIRSVMVFPNPTSGIVYLSVPAGLRKNYTVVLSDNAGRQIFSKEYRNAESCSVDLSSFSNGVYILHVYSGNAKFRQKVILRK